MTDLFDDHARSLDCPPSRIFTIAPDDALELDISTRAIMVTSSGDVAIETVDGDTGVLPGLTSGIQYAIRARKILQTGTTAVGIVGLA